MCRRKGCIKQSGNEKRSNKAVSQEQVSPPSLSVWINSITKEYGWPHVLCYDGRDWKCCERRVRGLTFEEGQHLGKRIDCDAWDSVGSPLSPECMEFSDLLVLTFLHCGHLILFRLINVFPSESDTASECLLSTSGSWLSISVRASSISPSSKVGC